MRTSPTGDRRVGRGFTIVEVLVVVVIVAVLAGMIMPQVTGSWAKRKLSESARRLLIAARRGRAEAVLLGRDVQLVLAEDPARFRLEMLGEPGPGQAEGEFGPIAGRAGRWQALESGVRFGAVQIRPTASVEPSEPLEAVTFTPHGEADFAVIEVTDAERSWTLQIAPYTGRTQLSEGRAEAMPGDRLDLDAR
ncbi:MAG: prepilin-type N-terminal cleavage/methylation domain-containing protein [Phycisphaeraceae bacterium]